jgi:hypothetical protein
MNPLQLFRAGRDYIEIADHFGTTEDVIEIVIDRLRTSERLVDRAEAALQKQAANRFLQRKVAAARARDQLREIREQRA